MPANSVSREQMVLDDLPSAPEIARAVLVEMDRDDFSARRLAALIVRDHALAAALIRLANSVVFAGPIRVTTVPHAVTALGFARVRELALALSAWNTFEGWTGKGRHFRPLLWQHAAAVGTVTKVLAERAHLAAADAFTAGLLHDIGKLALGFRLRDAYWNTLTDAGHAGVPVEQLEVERFGVHHGTVGEWLLRRWQFPGIMVDLVARHHDPIVPEALDLPAIVSLADMLVHGTNLETGVMHEDVIATAVASAPALLLPDDWSSSRFVRLQRESLSSLEAAPRAS